MNLNHIFCMSGCGYLHDIIQRSDKFIARIKMFTHYDSSTLSRDDVWIECEVSDKHQQALLTTLLNAVQTGNSVILTFKAEYTAFLNAQSGLAPEDPSHIVMLQGKLRTVEESFINGQPTRTDPFRLRAVA